MSEGQLAALGARLAAFGFRVELAADLRVVDASVRGCCAEVAHPSDRVTCRAREDDGGRLWFWTSWGEPIAEAARVEDAAIAINGMFARRTS
ncbi:hypothetical protein [Actinomadura gamaensis]|uniref:Uncharacterized protein n=1 Tax=Actinomadura gamaensis TaxID=1763541 RepID=A0ABV9UCB6_9ACTN